MEDVKLIRVMDDDGSIYQIPEDLLEDFDALAERVADTEFMSEAEEVAISDLHYHFVQYRVG
jgi:hypothetical protein